MNAFDIARQRLFSQQIALSTLQSPTEVVAWLGAVQAQDFMGSLWSLGLRMHIATEAAVEQAFADGAILRTHIMRPTWHFVAPADIRWLLALTAPRVHAINATYLRQHELHPAVVARCHVQFVNALEGGNALTRAELGLMLAQNGISTSNSQLGIIIMAAELDGILVSGARRGKQFTYALLDERAPHGTLLARDEALATLVLRYFRGHGWATVQDFAWWSGLTLTDTRAGIESVKTQLVSEIVEGQTYWMSADAPQVQATAADMYLLPGFDEYLISYTDRSASLPPKHYSVWAGSNAVFTNIIVIDGQVVGTWKRALKSKSVFIEAVPFAPFSPEQRTAFAAQIQHYGAFLGLNVVMA